VEQVPCCWVRGGGQDQKKVKRGPNRGGIRRTAAPSCGVEEGKGGGNAGRGGGGTRGGQTLMISVLGEKELPGGIGAFEDQKPVNVP